MNEFTPLYGWGGGAMGTKYMYCVTEKTATEAIETQTSSVPDNTTTNKVDNIQKYKETKHTFTFNALYSRVFGGHFYIKHLCITPILFL